MKQSNSVARWVDKNGQKTDILMCTLTNKIAKTCVCEECNVAFCVCTQCKKKWYWWKRVPQNVHVDQCWICEAEEDDDYIVAVELKRRLKRVFLKPN